MVGDRGVEIPMPAVGGRCNDLLLDVVLMLY